MCSASIAAETPSLRLMVRTVVPLSRMPSMPCARIAAPAADSSAVSVVVAVVTPSMASMASMSSPLSVVPASASCESVELARNRVRMDCGAGDASSEGSGADAVAMGMPDQSSERARRGRQSGTMRHHTARSLPCPQYNGHAALNITQVCPLVLLALMRTRHRCPNGRTTRHRYQHHQRGVYICNYHPSIHLSLSW